MSVDMTISQSVLPQQCRPAKAPFSWMALTTQLIISTISSRGSGHAFVPTATKNGSSIKMMTLVFVWTLICLMSHEAFNDKNRGKSSASSAL